MTISPSTEPSNDGTKSPDDGEPCQPSSTVTLNHVTESEDNDKQESVKNDNNIKEENQNEELPKSEEQSKSRKLDGYVGFANLPNQVYRTSVKKGFDFSLMVVGESGLGKSTLVNSMFLAEIYGNDHPGPSLRIKKTVAVEETKVLLKENGVNLTLTIVDTPGFGDAVDNSNCWIPIIEYIESKYEDFLNAESRVMRNDILDGRVHCCLYFISPTGHGLKPLDVEFMKRIHEKVNIVPVIAKADTMTPEECADFKQQILNEIAKHKIKIYSFPDNEEEEDNKLHKILKEKVPFAVVGTTTIVEHEGKKIRGRKYPWGVVEVENLGHCDFLALRNMVIRTHLQDLKDVTNEVHYENYRVRKLATLTIDGNPANVADKNPLAQLEEEKQEHEIKMKKMAAEMEEVFEIKVKEKRQKLADIKAEYDRRYQQMRQSLDEELQELQKTKRAFEAAKKNWEQQTGFSIQEWRKNPDTNSKVTFGSTISSAGGGDTLKGSRGLGSLLRRHTSVKSLQDNPTPLQPIIQHPEHV